MKTLDWRDCYDPAQPVIYVAGPYDAPTREGIDANIRRAVIARDRLIAAGWAVVCPHTNTAYMDNSDPSIFYRMYLSVLARCDAIYMLEGWLDSIGATMEYDLALETMYGGHKIIIYDGGYVPAAKEFRESYESRVKYVNPVHENLTGVDEWLKT